MPSVPWRSWALGVADVLAVAYFHAMRYRPEDPEWERRDRFPLSIGHCAIAHYAALIEAGIIPEAELDTYGADDSRLPMSSMASYTPGMKISGGSLGQGLALAVGYALALKRKRSDAFVHCLSSDGECGEGAVWEGASGIALSADMVDALADAIPELLSCAPDLEGATQHKRRVAPFTAGDQGGQYIHYGIREHAMGAMMNGLAAHDGVVPVGVTYLVFSDYMRPTLRLAAMMGLPVPFVFSHDSIGIGRNGPTHRRGTARVAVKAAVRQGWDRYIAEEGGFVGRTGYGASGPADELFVHFGVTPECVAAEVRERL